MKIHAANRTNSGLLKEVNAVELYEFLTNEINVHEGELSGKSGETEEWEKGFVAGLKYAKEMLGMVRRWPE